MKEDSRSVEDLLVENNKLLREIIAGLRELALEKICKGHRVETQFPSLINMEVDCNYHFRPGETVCPRCGRPRGGA